MGEGRGGEGASEFYSILGAWIHSPLRADTYSERTMCIKANKKSQTLPSLYKMAENPPNILKSKKTFLQTETLKFFTRHCPDVIKLFSCSTQLSMIFVLLIILRLLTNCKFFLT